MTKRKKYSAEFKVKVGLGSVGRKTYHGPAFGQVWRTCQPDCQWTAKIRKGAIEVIATGHARKARQHEDEILDLHAKIGQLTVERDFLAKAFGR